MLYWPGRATAALTQDGLLLLLAVGAAPWLAPLASWAAACSRSTCGSKRAAGIARSAPAQCDGPLLCCMQGAQGPRKKLAPPASKHGLMCAGYAPGPGGACPHPGRRRTSC